MEDEGVRFETREKGTGEGVTTSQEEVDGDYHRLISTYPLGSPLPHHAVYRHGGGTGHSAPVGPLFSLRRAGPRIPVHNLRYSRYCSRRLDLGGPSFAQTLPCERRDVQ